jgi:tripeptidyl-peptidase-1
MQLLALLLRSAAAASVVSSADLCSTHDLTLMEPSASQPARGQSTPLLGDETVRVVVAVKHRNVAALEALFWAVSDPASAQYGDHLSLLELTRRFGPSGEALSEVSRWVHGCGGSAVRLHPATPGSEFVAVTGPAADVGRLLNCRMVRIAAATQGGKQGGRAATACEGGHYALPASIAKHVDFVAGAVYRRHRVRSLINQMEESVSTAPSVGSPMGEPMGEAGAETTPGKLRAMYGVNASVAASPLTSQATAQFYTGRAENNFSPADLDKFNALYVLRERDDGERS